jgi:hypothetical protein
MDGVFEAVQTIIFRLHMWCFWATQVKSLRDPANNFENGNKRRGDANISALF